MNLRVIWSDGISLKEFALDTERYGEEDELKWIRKLYYYYRTFDEMYLHEIYFV